MLRAKPRYGCLGNVSIVPFQTDLGVLQGGVLRVLQGLLHFTHLREWQLIIMWSGVQTNALVQCTSTLNYDVLIWRCRSMPDGTWNWGFGAYYYNVYYQHDLVGRQYMYLNLWWQHFTTSFNKWMVRILAKISVWFAIFITDNFNPGTATGRVYVVLW